MIKRSDDPYRVNKPTPSLTHHSVGGRLHHDRREDSTLASVGALPPAVVHPVVVGVCELDEGTLGKAELLFGLRRVLVHRSEEGGWGGGGEDRGRGVEEKGRGEGKGRGGGERGRWEGVMVRRGKKERVGGKDDRFSKSISHTTYNKFSERMERSILEMIFIFGKLGLSQ